MVKGKGFLYKVNTCASALFFILFLYSSVFSYYTSASGFYINEKYAQSDNSSPVEKEESEKSNNCDCDDDFTDHVFEETYAFNFMSSEIKKCDEILTNVLKDISTPPPEV